eukprot:g3211.t1
MSKSKTVKEVGNYFLASGILEKQRDGAFRDGWSKRFVVLTPQILRYYKSTVEGGLLAELRGSLHVSAILNVTFQGNTLQITFKSGKLMNMQGLTLLNTSSNMITFRGKDEEEIKQWAEVLESTRGAVFKINASKPTVGLPTTASLDEDSSYFDLSKFIQDLEKNDCSVQAPELPWNIPAFVIIGFVGLSNAILYKLLKEKFKNLDDPFFLVYVMALASFVPTVIAIWLSRASNGYVADVNKLYFKLDNNYRLRSKTRMETKRLFNRDLSSISSEQTLTAGGYLSDDSYSGDLEEKSKSNSDSITEGWKYGKSFVQTETLCDNNTPHEYGNLDKIFARKPRPEERTWSNARGDHFIVRRGPNYSTNKQKTQSKDSMYTCVGFELVESSTGERIKEVGSLIGKVDFVEGITEADMHGSVLPRVIMVHAQVPYTAPSVYSGIDPSDAGCSAIFVFHITKETLKVSKDIANAPNHVKLLSKYVDACEGGPGRPMGPGLAKMYEWSDKSLKRRFKVIGVVDNVDDLADEMGYIVSNLVKNFNGKPVIIHNTGMAGVFPAESKSKGENDDQSPYIDRFEVLIKTCDFKYSALQGLASVRALTPKMLLSVGFVIQGEPDDELPECMIGGTELHYVSMEAGSAVRL